MESVIDAAFQTASVLPGWYVPREFIEELYERRNVKDAGGFDEQLKAIGEALTERFDRRQYERYDGHRLDMYIFRDGCADSFIHKLDWVASFKEGRPILRSPSTWFV